MNVDANPNNDEWLNILKDALAQAFPNSQISDDIDSMAQFTKSKNIGWHSDETSKQLGVAFLNETDRDIKSCRVLCSKKIYPHAIYHFQQAVEKAMKAYCLGLGILSIEEIRGHDTPYVLLKGLFEKTGMKAMFKGSNSQSKILLDKAWEVKDDPVKRLGIAKMPFDQIMYELECIDADSQRAKLIADATQAVLFKAAQSKGVNKPALPLILLTFHIMPCLYRLSVISFPHEAFTRYPDDEEMTPADYVSELGIVKALPKMINYLATAVKELRTSFSK